MICRQHFLKPELIRIVKDRDGKIFIDDTKKADGRGAYVCSNPECHARLVKTKALNKSFKTNVDDSVYEALKNSLNN